ncbi:MAG: hypothetical protein JWR58_5926, partial [Pseudonocardia sp.]|nr:hypothetical protein [Pseudonocardia sp.]
MSTAAIWWARRRSSPYVHSSPDPRTHGRLSGG